MNTKFNEAIRKTFWLALAGGALATQVVATTPVFINELHYDNASTDTGEFVEIAGPAGTDLTGWTIELYNGSGGARYDSDALTGTIPDEGSGYGTVVISYPSNGIQNGAPDGVALVNNGTVVQFLCYEGTFQATDNAASGMTCADIGVAESSSPVGESLGLTGTGTEYEDFNWTGPSTESPGSINAGQTFTAASETVVITEIMQNPSAVGDSNGEWFEVFNPGATDVNMTGWTILDDGADIHVIAGPLTVPAGGYAVLGNDGNTLTNGGVTVDYVYSDFFLANSDDEVVILDDANETIDRVNYGNGLTFPDPTGKSMTLGDVNADNNDGANWCEATSTFGDGDLGTPGAANDACAVVPPSVTLIHDVQGSGAASPLAGSEVTIRGIVVGDFQDSLSGFFVQEEDADTDDNNLTSEGIFVYSTTAVNVGDDVNVTGTVVEYFDLTEISPVSSVIVNSSGNPLPTAARPVLPLVAADALERFEGMLVEFNQTLYVTEHYNLARYGEVLLSSADRLAQPTNIALPGAPANAIQTANDLNQILLDDGSTVQNPDPIVYPDGDLNATNTLRGGDTLETLTGVMTYSFDVYRVHPTVTPSFVHTNPRPSTAPVIDGKLKVAAFNVLNYFTTIDTGAPICGPLNDQDCRGADSASELTRQQDKLVEALSKLDADVIGLMELENTDQTSIADLASRLSGYDYIANPAGDGVELGTDAITVGILYKTATVAPVGVTATVADGYGSTDLSTACGGGVAGIYPFDDYNRKPLAQTFKQNAGGATFTVVVNHFKSKGSLTGYTLDDDQLDGQGNNNCTRTVASETLLEWLTTDPTDSNDTDFLIMGDLNAYAMEDPITAFTDAGYTNLVTGYSYVFNGQWGSLDHILSSPSMTPQVAEGAKWHINADEPRALDYNEEFKSVGQVTSLYNDDEYRTSDHDPVIIGLDLQGGQSAQPAILMYLLN